MLILFDYLVTDVAREMFTHIPITLSVLNTVWSSSFKEGYKRSLAFNFLDHSTSYKHLLEGSTWTQID